MERAKLIVFGLLAGAALCVTPAATQRNPRTSRQIVTINRHPAVAGEVLVKFRRALAPHERGLLDQQTDADYNSAIGSVGLRRIHSRSRHTSALLAFFQNHPDVAYVEPNYIVVADTLPVDTWFGELWGLRNIGQTVGKPGTFGADIGATLAWDVSTGSRANVVAVVDTGVDYAHSDLAANIWSAPFAFNVTIGGQTITCPAGSHGFNAILKTCDPDDDNGHGTHVSGTIGAIGNDNLGVTGVNWTASIMASKFLDANGTGTTADAINAIEFVIQAAAATGANVRILSNSWTNGGFSQGLLDEINKANTKNMLFVASAGNNSANNDTVPRYPASYGAPPYNAPNVIAVAATDNNDNLASFSNFGSSSVHLAAPGVNILSTIPGEAYQYLTGTSMAAPHVSGAAALVLSRCNLNTAALKDSLLASVDPIPSLAGVLITGGRLNINSAIRTCDLPPPDFSLSASPPTQSVTAGSGDTASYSVTVTPSGAVAGTVTLGASGLPSGATASFNPPSITASGSSTMTITSSSSTPTGSFPVSISGTSGGLIHTVSVTFVQNARPLAVDKVVFADGAGTTKTPSFSTSSSQETLIAFAASDGPVWGAQVLTVTGAGLTWSLVKRVNTEAGTSEIWQANTTVALSNVTVNSTPLFDGFDQSLLVVTFSGAAGIGAVAGWSGASGSPAVSLTTTRAGSLVYGVGNDWDAAIPRTADADQAIVHEWADTRVGDTFWMQARTGAVASAGTAVSLGAAMPDTDRWNFAAVEILSAGSGASSSTVPNVVNLTRAAATTAITNAGLAVGAITTASSTNVPVDSVITQNPTAGTQVAIGSVVALVVSSGPPLVAVPNVVAMTQADAATAITNAGLVVGAITNASSTTAPAGSVMSENPTAGTQVAIGSAVALVVSSGPFVAVPNVVNMTQAAATTAIMNAGLAVGAITNASSTTVPAGSVISENPMAGTQVAVGSAVALMVSSGPPLVAVPNVVNMTQAAATTAITNAGLAVGAITNASSTTVPAGSVISENPTAGTQVAIGSAVALVVSSGPPPVVTDVAVDRVVASDGRGTRTTPAFSTSAPGALLVAFAASDGSISGGQRLTVSGAGLTWTLVRRANAQAGTAEIWKATAPTQLSNATVTSTQLQSGYDQSLTVVAFTGATGIGASAAASAASGAASVTLTTTTARALVYGVGNDWDNAIPRGLSTGQAMVRQWVDTRVGDTFWVQAWPGIIEAAGTSVPLGTKAPTQDRWNFAVVEIVP
jgi:beta-lactam-binding protein with PASTA domain/subtilisin family serine protease